MKALRMSLEQDLKRVRRGAVTAAEAREKSKKLHSEAIALVRAFPHVGKISYAMWAISTYGLAAVTATAEVNLSTLYFKLALKKMSPRT